MSLLNVDTVEPEGATTDLTLGAGGDKVVIPGTIKISGGSPGADKLLTSDASGDATWEDAAAGGLTHKSQWRLTTDFADSVDPLKLYWTAVEADDPRSTDTTPDSNTALGAPMDLDTATGYWTFPTTGWWNVEFVCTYLPANYANTPTGGLIKYATDGATFETVFKQNGSTEGGYSQLSVGSVFFKN